MKNSGWRTISSYKGDIDEALDYAPQEAVMETLKEVSYREGHFTHRVWLIPYKMMFPDAPLFTKPVKPKKNDHKGKQSIRTAITAYDEELAMLDEMEALAAIG